MKKQLLAGSLVGAALLLSAPLAFAQSTTTSSGSTGSTTPTAPNTGAGGGLAQNLAVLGISGAVAAAGAVYLATRKRSA